MENGVIMETPETSQLVESPLSPSSQVYTDFLKLHREKKSSVNSDSRDSPNKPLSATQNYHDFIESHLQSKAILKSPPAPAATEALLDPQVSINGKDDDVSDVTMSTQAATINIVNGVEKVEDLAQSSEDILQLEKQNQELFSALDEHIKETKMDRDEEKGDEQETSQPNEQGTTDEQLLDEGQEGREGDLNQSADQGGKDDLTPNGEAQNDYHQENGMVAETEHAGENGLMHLQTAAQTSHVRPSKEGKSSVGGILNNLWQSLNPSRRKKRKEGQDLEAGSPTTGNGNSEAVDNGDANGTNTVQGEIEVIQSKEEMFNQVQKPDIAEIHDNKDTVDLENMTEEERKEFASKLKDDVATLETCIDEITKNSENDESKPAQLIPPSDEKEPSNQGSSSSEGKSLRYAIKRIEQAFENIRYLSLGYILVGLTVIGMGIFSMLGIPAWSAGLFVLVTGLMNLGRKNAANLLVTPNGFRRASLLGVLLLLASAGVFLFSSMVITSLDGTPTCPGDNVNTVCLIPADGSVSARLDCDKNMSVADFQSKQALCESVFLCSNETMLFAPCHTKATINMAGFILCAVMAVIIFFISGWIQVLLDRSVSDCNRVRNGGRSIHFADMGFTAYLQYALCCAKTPEEAETTDV